MILYQIYSKLIKISNFWVNYFDRQRKFFFYSLYNLINSYFYYYRKIEHSRIFSMYKLNSVKFRTRTQF